MVIKIFEEDVSICLIDKQDEHSLHPSDLTPKKHYIALHVFHQFYQFILLPKVSKSDCIVVTLLLFFNFLALKMLLVML